MALLQISEPGQSTKPHERRLAAGIDLGTTNSLVATVRSAMAETLPDADGEHLLPSVVRFTADGEPVVGVAAKQAVTDDPRNTIVSVKRGLSDAHYEPSIVTSQTPAAFFENRKVRTPTAACR